VRRFATKFVDRDCPLEGFPVGPLSNYEGTIDYLLPLDAFLLPSSSTVSSMISLQFSILAKHIGPNSIVDAFLPITILKPS